MCVSNFYCEQQLQVGTHDIKSLCLLCYVYVHMSCDWYACLMGLRVVFELPKAGGEY